ncbi:tetratricopeptide repeat protein [Sphingobium sufflavum]|uniref:tetratricopeptide repeat protein n=1 Tax=Sphingobium sufflavum TaxID=1129547 RepID=UPI001F271CAC|nr:tetratricopeptide repeat protein [Sphingobium sufflavum]MCE7797400.1 tetratricopeptide repeat protein [Sphingobium sufflavum]
MTGLFIAGGLALLVAIGISLFARIGKGGWEPVATVLLIGLAGYAWQGRPGLAGAPVTAKAARTVHFDEGMAQRRRAMGERVSGATKWFVLSDALARQGDTQGSVNLLSAAVRSDPKDANLWVGLGNALMLHGEDVLSPAADYAYRQALRLAPAAPSPRFFYGLALARAGKLEPARAIWGELAASLPVGSPFRVELESNLAAIDRLLAAQGGGAAAPTP